MEPQPKSGSSERSGDDSNSASEESRSLNFIEQIIERDRAAGKNDGRVHTRFPPEPNGYLHIGHAKSICLNFGLAKRYGGQCNLRFDDTNPTKEDVEYVDSIQADVKWLGFDWEDRLYYASDRFEDLYQFAERLIQEGLAYVDSQNLEEMRANRGTVNESGKDSRDRTRSVDENLDLFRRMRAGEFEDGAHVLRAKIDMAHPNMLMRDPLLYRIRHAHHHRTGNKWCIYPMYDWTHGQCDSLEGITHSICTLEFETHRALYDWFIEKLDLHHPQQIEFARLNLNYTVMSKRKLLELVENKLVSGWDDPRMPTICGLRRRGFTPESIRAFCDRIGIARMNSVVDLSWLEQAIRDDLNTTAPRVMGVLRPLKVVIENYPEDQIDELEAANHPADESFGKRIIPFSREVYVEQDDFLEDAPRKYFRLSPGREVRLRYAYLVTCTGVVKDDHGNVIEVRCTYDPESKGGNAPDGRKVKGTIHWVSAKHAVDAEVRLYDRLFSLESPDDVPEGQDWKDGLNPDSLEVLSDAKLEPSLAAAEPGARFQFERNGYFCVDQNSSPEKLTFNRTATLRDSWAKQNQ
ncbi:MAG: glutamine--tRNA ligase/YqeY domain fusion protein [Planctomycetota bacterium]|nr:glutamine--tRNA ligase/YqeY domain fusion protein [Planctomycetota bacterium]MDA0920017.1 glutamine--tRNA ligase/YqeY domain fusion protein [Planctomycetota bacterium]MDA1159621.1 glutamine--tRNA ligase/YqeY domain fusion protein [Planctomycetota bacterium]